METVGRAADREAEEAHAEAALALEAMGVERMGIDEARSELAALEPEGSGLAMAAEEAGALAEVANVERMRAGRPSRQPAGPAASADRGGSRRYDLSEYWRAVDYLGDRAEEEGERERRAGLLRSRIGHLERLAELERRPDNGPSPLEAYLSEFESDSDER